MSTVQQDLKLYYRKPAKRWLQALPLGNGRIGAMVHGEINREVIQLNEDSVWTRGPKDRNNPDALQTTDVVRQLLAEGRIEEAHDWADMGMMGVSRRQPPYQTLGELNLFFPGHRESEASDYRRELDLETGIAKVSYRIGDTAYEREIFSTAADQALIVRLTADRPGSISLGANLFRKFDAITEREGPDTVGLDGQCGIWGTRFHACLKAVPEGGSIRSLGDHIVVEGADAVTLVLTAATDFRHEAYRERCREELLSVGSLPYSRLRENHVAEQIMKKPNRDTGISPICSASTRTISCYAPASGPMRQECRWNAAWNTAEAEPAGVWPGSSACGQGLPKATGQAK